jgi:hypothetical protein
VFRRECAAVDGWFETMAGIVFGGLAIVVTCVTVDPWLCVAGFRRVCHYRYELGKALDGMTQTGLGKLTQARREETTYDFGGLAVVVTCVTVDPWLCVAGFRRVYGIGFFLLEYILHCPKKPFHFCDWALQT